MSSCSRRRVSPHPEPNLHTGIIIAILDIALIVHAAKTGRFMPWGFIILFLPGIGALAYVVVELIPEWFGSYGARRARRQFAGAINPAGRYRQLHDELEIVDTIANRSALAWECLTLGKYDEALAQRDPGQAPRRGARLRARQGARRIWLGQCRRCDRDARRPQAAMASLSGGRWPSALCDGA